MRPLSLLPRSLLYIPRPSALMRVEERLNLHAAMASRAGRDAPARRPTGRRIDARLFHFLFRVIPSVLFTNFDVKYAS